MDRNPTHLFSARYDDRFFFQGRRDHRNSLAFARSRLPFRACTVPSLFVIDGRGIRIHYFFAKESYLWKNINWVEVRYSPPTRGKCIPYLFDTITINGKSEEKKRFFMQGEIARSRRARKLIEKYSGKKIEGYFSDDVKAFFEKRKAKKEKTKKQKKHQKRT